MKLQDEKHLSLIAKVAPAVLFALFCVTALSAQTSTFVTFDAPGSGAQGTFPVGINHDGVIAGFYADASGAFHGFVRQANGVITEVLVPGVSGILVTGINDAGQVVGSGNTKNSQVGFVVNADGKSATFTVAGASRFNATGINGRGEVTGNYFGSDSREHSFFRDAAGKITTFDDPDATKATGNGTLAWEINDRGQIAGFYNKDANTGVNRAFLRDRSGKFKNFDVSPTGDAIEIGIAAINAQGEIVGQFFGNDSIQYAFVRDPSGKVTDFAVQNSQLNSANSVNATGRVVGSWEQLTSPFATLAFLRDATGNIRTFTAPFPNVSTNPTGINALGKVTGAWEDLNFVSHGFVR